MSKKKNTLKDLDEFLKQQAATLVTPEKLSEANQEPAGRETIQPASPAGNLSLEDILTSLKQLSENDSEFRKNLYDLIVRALEAQANAHAEDKILINTALYLKHGKNWKEAIRDYWRNAD